MNDKKLTKRDINPKDAIGSKKVPMSVVSAPVMMEIALAMMEGARKYGAHNYRVAGVRASVYYDACMRHLMAWHEGENIDIDSGLSHISKALGCLTVLRDSMILGNWKDDRPVKHKDGWVQDANRKAKEIIDKYPKSLEPYTESEQKEKQKDGGKNKP